jgi:hypothetical protein
MATKLKTVPETIKWISVLDDQPDEGVLVLLYAESASEPTWPGYLDALTACGCVWSSADGSQIDGVTHWAEMPAGPKVK